MEVIHWPHRIGGWFDAGRARIFDIGARLKRLEGLGDPLLGFARVVDFEIFRPELEKALAYASGRKAPVRRLIA